MKDEPLNDAERALIRALRELRFGSVSAVVHEGRLVRLERNEKIRFEGDPARGELAGDATQHSRPRPDRRSPPQRSEGSKR